jgi:hypothetical protein
MAQRIYQTDRATYCQHDNGHYQATTGQEPTNDAGYKRLDSLMLLKGEPLSYGHQATDRYGKHD